MTEHFRPNGLSHGYYCPRCGGICNMYAAGHGEGKCEENAELVAELNKLNSAENVRKQIFIEGLRRCNVPVND